LFRFQAHPSKAALGSFITALSVDSAEQRSERNGSRLFWNQGTEKSDRAWRSIRHEVPQYDAPSHSSGDIAESGAALSLASSFAKSGFAGNSAASSVSCVRATSLFFSREKDLQSVLNSVGSTALAQVRAG